MTEGVPLHTGRHHGQREPASAHPSGKGPGALPLVVREGAGLLAGGVRSLRVWLRILPIYGVRTVHYHAFRCVVGPGVFEVRSTFIFLGPFRP